MIDTWNPAKLNEKISGRDSWNPAILNEAVTDRDSWNPAILNESAGETPVVFEATITALFPEGATCTATDGTTTLTADDNPMAFSIPNEGTWAVACVANGVTFSENVVITTNGQTETVDLTPDGATVTPTDSVPMLIACAGIGDSDITTIAGALADVEILTAILESENAIDYLVRSTTFASDVTADSVAMTGIGAINYDANTLLSNSTWLTAICNSQYFESVLNTKVPVMTDDTTPYGVCGCTYYYPGYPAYKAFDGDTTPTSQNAWSSGNRANEKLWYQFVEELKVYLIKFYPNRSSGFSCSSKDWDILSSQNGTDWNVEVTGSNLDSTDAVSVINNNPSMADYWGCIVKTSFRTDSFGVQELQFYGRVDVN